MYYVYVLQSLKTLELYKGLTDNIERRIAEHLNGEEKSTRFRLPMRLVHVELCKSRTEARKLERFFKSGYGREILKEIISEIE